MSTDTTGLADALQYALVQARGLADRLGVPGYGVAHLTDSEGRTKAVIPFTNLVTDVGDLYYATRVIAAVSPAAASDATKVTGLQIGTNTSTAPTKSGAGGGLVGTLLSGQAFDATYPQTSNLGGGLGVNAVYKTTWAAGTGTGTIGEVVLTNTATLGTAASTALTIARAQIAAGTGVAKGVSDSLAITWNHTFLGS